ncbi:MAG: L-seryl-tRNA(Sec) selenium transferase [Caldilineaceae bacterium SB0670_bin_27]|uniref:L-seryl-tRNA(Sec) selenium transferase n=1 Tax=Caldilineaceae bacterium SB0664_bin_27 TaxID=2605260 RepID=A0A6B0YVS8_9CHLR|nr:L-seryl-tRNA(Sec) selenium transferase [Caldilineaceae bacterium SB0664_bin_27]MYJ78071.1 L-seryl-tRNA(Sec) selenium transferase [Caldilineaceae bacterium SB0670_bin_27]
MTESVPNRPPNVSDGKRAGSKDSEFRKLPAVDKLLSVPEIAALAAAYGSVPVTEATRAELDAARIAIESGEPAPTEGQWRTRIADSVLAASSSSLRPVINATGVIIHTNLGRTPLGNEAQNAVVRLAQGYSTLEYDLDAGRRGSRHAHPARLLCQLSGAEDALVVNNNAAAVFLALTALCQGREVIVSRGELVEIGGGFRIPDVLRQSGATLVEVGTTNRTHPHDFAGAIGPRTAALMRIHASNFKQVGFVTKPELSELVGIAREQETARSRGAAEDADARVESEPAGEVRSRVNGGRPLVIDDLGSGTLLDTAQFGLAPEPMVQSSVQAGADIITFSGDKLLGGPQAGLIVGKAELIGRLRAHPLARALRVDKMTLAALDATLQSYRRGRVAAEIPVWRMIAEKGDTVQKRAREFQRRLNAAKTESTVIPGKSTIGGGSLPGETLPTSLLAIDMPRPDGAAALLRTADPPVICRIQNDQLLFDLRTVLPEQEQALLEILCSHLPDLDGEAGGAVL